jgi:hypothetical protein
VELLRLRVAQLRTADGARARARARARVARWARA